MLVTGGLGFIGSNFILHTAKNSDPHQIINIDSLSFGSNPENLREIENSEVYRFVRADINDTSIVSDQMADADIVVHFAAETHVDRSISEPKTFLHSNVDGTFTLLEAARHSKISKFVQISTDEVYGSAPSNETFDENSPLNPSSPYSASNIRQYDSRLQVCVRSSQLFACSNTHAKNGLHGALVLKVRGGSRHHFQICIC